MDNQFAFPSSSSDYVDEPGMDLLDYFAAKAMQALITKYGIGIDKERTIERIGLMANDAYAIATEMLKQR